MAHEVPFEDLVDWVEGRLAPDEAARLEAHIAGCAGCAADVAWLRRVVGLMASDQLVDAPAALVARAQGLYRPPRRRFAGLAGLWGALKAPGLRRAGAVALTVLLLAGTLLAWSFVPVAQAATLAEVAGPVEVQMPGSAQWMPAVAGLKVEAGYALRLGAGATAVVQYADGSRTMLAEGAEVYILAIDGRRNGSTSNARLKQAAGHTRHEVGSEHSSIQVETDAAVARASEADYDVWVDDGETQVVAGQGQVSLSTGQGSTKLKPGERGQAAPGRLKKVATPAPSPAAGEQPAPQTTDSPDTEPADDKPGRGPKTFPADKPGRGPKATPAPEPAKDPGPQGKATPKPGQQGGKPKAAKTPPGKLLP